MAKKSLINLITGGTSDNEPEEEKAMPEETHKEDWSETEDNLTIDVYQDKDDIVIKSTIAGVGRDDIDITITSDMVTIEGSREESEKVDFEDYYHQELYWGSFSRSIVLPQEIDTEAARADISNGLLTIRLPKLERSKTKKLKIK